MFRGLIGGIKVQEITANGSTQAGATPIAVGPSNVAMAVCATALSNVAVVLPPAIAPRVMYLVSSGGTISLFPDTDDEIFLGGALGPNLAYSMADGTGAILYCAADGLWWGVATG